MTKRRSKTPKLFHNPTHQLIASGVLFVAAGLLANNFTISKLETILFNAAYQLPGWLHGFFYVVTQFGSIYLLGVLLVLYMTRQHYHIVIRLLMTGTLAYLLAGFAKGLWGRARPHELLPDIITLDYFQGAGFPSGHVALATALALVVGHYIAPKLYWLPILWIGLVAFSRMYLGVHLPLDIIGGFAIGWFSYALFRHVRLYDVRYKQKIKQ